MADKHIVMSDGNQPIKIRVGQIADFDLFALSQVLYDGEGYNVHRRLNGINYFSQDLLDGGSENMAVDGSTTAVDFVYDVPAGKLVHLSLVNIIIEDGNNDFVPSDFGAIGGGLSNGVEISITKDGGSKTVLETLVNNRQLRETVTTFDQSFKAAGVYTAVWEFGIELFNDGLFMSENDNFTVKIQDDLSGLDFMSFRLKGIIEDAI
jgi:hypothetical protein